MMIRLKKKNLVKSITKQNFQMKLLINLNKEFIQIKARKFQTSTLKLLIFQTLFKLNKIMFQQIDV